MNAHLTANLLGARHARVLLLGALILGLAADTFMPEPPWRSGLSLWLVIAVPVTLLCMTGVAARASAGFARDRNLLVGAMLLGALGFTFRDAPELYATCFLATLLAAALLAWRASSLERSLADIRFTDLAGAGLQAGVGAAFGAPLLALQDSRDRTGAVPERTAGRPLAFVGVLLAVPVVLIIGALLGDADPVFRALLRRWFDLPFEEAVTHVVRVGFFTWVVAGWLRSFFRPTPVQALVRELESLRPSSGFALLAPAMYSTILLLVVFLFVQARALFGGASFVELTSGLTYAEYAREGFFGLVVVAGLVLALLVAGEWLLGRPDQRDLRRFRFAGWALIALVAVVVASSAQRLSLYMSLYGLTTSRVYAAAFTIALALAVAWCGMTVMRGWRQPFAAGLLALGAATVVALHVLNPERLVVRVNGSRAAAGAEFDVAYHASLSADALPSLREAARALVPEQCTALAIQLQERWQKRFAEDRKQGQGGWSVPRARAARLLDAPAEQVVRSMCGGG